MIEFIERHLAERQAHHHANRTLEICRYWLLMFARFCEQRDLSLETLSPADLEAYRQHLLWTPGPRTKALLSPNTVDQSLRMVRAFLRWLVRSGQLASDPSAEWILCRPPCLPAEPILSRAELEAILNRPDCTTPIGLRDRAVLGLMAELGFSARVCSRLNVADFDQAQGRLKGVTLSPHLNEFLCRYLHRGRPALLTDPAEPALFLSRAGNRVREDNLTLMPHRHSHGKARPRSLRRAWLTYREANLNRRLPEI